LASGRHLEKNLFQGFRQVDREEAIRGVAVVFSALVDDSEIAVRLGVSVSDDTVQLADLEGRLIAPVFDAHGEPRRRFPRSLHLRLLTYDVVSEPEHPLSGSATARRRWRSRILSACSSGKSNRPPGTPCCLRLETKGGERPASAARAAPPGRASS